MTCLNEKYEFIICVFCLGRRNILFSTVRTMQSSQMSFKANRWNNVKHVSVLAYSCQRKKRQTLNFTSATGLETFWSFGQIKPFNILMNSTCKWTQLSMQVVNLDCSFYLNSCFIWTTALSLDLIPVWRWTCWFLL